VRYVIGGEEYARYECSLLAGEDFVRVRDASKLGAGMAFRFRLTGRDAPTSGSRSAEARWERRRAG